MTEQSIALCTIDETIMVRSRDLGYFPVILNFIYVGYHWFWLKVHGEAELTGTPLGQQSIDILYFEAKWRINALVS